MTDRFSPEKRSEIMSRVKNKDTKPEIAVRSILHRMGYRFRIHRSDLPGKPDIVLPKYGAVVFVNGCFWHGHKGCSRAARPSSNKSFWNKKIDRNKKRDLVVSKGLKSKGWRVLTIWQCQIRDEAALKERLRGFLNQDQE